MRWPDRSDQTIRFITPFSNVRFQLGVEFWGCIVKYLIALPLPDQAMKPFVSTYADRPAGILAYTVYYR